MERLLTLPILLFTLVQSQVIEFDVTRQAASTGRHLNTDFRYELPIQNKQNVQYLATVYFGSHGQKLDLIIDTGSSWTWLISEDCPQQQCAGDHYRNSQSTSFDETFKQHSITYKKGYVEGRISEDQVTFVAQPSGQEAMYDVQFLLVHYAEELGNLLADGLMGLAPNAPSDHPYDTLLEELYKNDIIASKMFSLYLADDS